MTDASPASLRIIGGSVVTPEEISQADVRVENGTITHIGNDGPAADETIDAGGMLLFPGLIDCHVHFREPGYEHKATMKSEMAAARFGGVTTACEMPNTVPPTVSIAALADKVRRADAIGADIRFFFGATQAEHLQALRRLFTDGNDETLRLKARCSGLKIYFDHSTGDQGVDETILDAAFALCAELGITLVAHCEDSALNAAAASAGDPKNVASHSLRRPPESEAAAVARAIDLARSHGTQFHVAHISTRAGVDLVRRAKKEGLHVTCEATTHHLFLTTDDYASLGAYAKVNPPLRSADDQAALWEGIADGTVDCVATDHAPHTREEKENADPLAAPSGMTGIATTLPLLLSVAAGQWPHPGELRAISYQLSASDIVRLCFTRPNEIFGLGRTGLAAGASTPIVIVDPAASWTIRGSDLPSLCGWTPYEGWGVRGKVVEIVE